VAGAPRRLSATHYDTDDLRLARWGASLRRRTGEGWTVKLPVQAAGQLLAREEARAELLEALKGSRYLALLDELVEAANAPMLARDARARWRDAWQAFSDLRDGWS